MRLSAADAHVLAAAEAMRELDRLDPRSELVTAVVLQLAYAQVDEIRARR